jgi:hypothetical protein
MVWSPAARRLFRGLAAFLLSGTAVVAFGQAAPPESDNAMVPERAAEPSAQGARPPVRPTRPLTPAEREAFRRLGEEQRQALSAPREVRPAPSQGGALNARERRRLREQLREEHERSRRRG